MITETANTANELAAFDDYLRYGTDEERSKGPQTRRSYLYTITILNKFLDGRKPAPELAKEFLKSLEEQGNKATSINRHIWAIKSYFRFLGRGSEFKIRGLKTVEYKPRYLHGMPGSGGEWDKLVDMAETPIYDPNLPDAARLRARKELALLYAYGGGGLRLSEAINLQNDDILKEGFLRVIRKGGHEDFVPVEDEVMRALNDYLAAKGQNGRYVFTGKGHDTPMAKRTAQGIIKALARRAGMDDVHVHSLRHTAGFQLSNSGAPISEIQDFLGHKNPQTTKIYEHLVMEERRRRLPKRFGKGRQGRLDWK